MRLFLACLLLANPSFAQGPERVECRIYWGVGGNPEAGGGKSYRNSFILDNFGDESTYYLFYQFGSNSYQLASDLSCTFHLADPAIFRCDNEITKTKDCVRVIKDGWKRTVLTKQSCLSSIPVEIKTREFIQTKALASGGCFPGK